MEFERRAMRIGMLFISFGVLWRLLFGGLAPRVQAMFRNPQVASFLVYLETGRVVPLPGKGSAAQLAVTPPDTETPQGTAREPPSFGPEEAQSLGLINNTEYPIDLEEFLLQPIDWDLQGEEPAVLILHTHTTESYQKEGESYEESAAYRTLDPDHNMVRIGDALARALEERGIRVIHDTTVHDAPAYTGSYGRSRTTAQRYLEQYPSIRVVLDLHRDAVERSDGSQLATEATVDGQPSAQLMMVVGTDAGGLTHPQWRENMAFATQLAAALERRWPGINRPIFVRTERFNEDLAPGAMLIEVGATGNTQAQALVAAEALAEALTDLAQGTNSS